MDGYYSYRTNRIAAVWLGDQRGARAQVPSALSADKAPIYPSPSESATGGGLNLRTMTHELAHQLAFNSGLQNRAVTYPFWLTEGLATNFEADNSGLFGLGPKDTVHRGRLIDAKAGARLMPLEQFVGMTDLSTGRMQTSEAYAQAWGLFHYLMQTRGRELKAYMASLAQARPASQDSQSLRRRFISAFGPIEQVEKGFGRFIDESAGGRTR
jgi:hypothetical protein